MPTITENDVEPCALRFERVGPEYTTAAALVFGEMSQESPERYLAALPGASLNAVAIGEGA